MKFIILDRVDKVYTALSRVLLVFDRNPKTFLGNNVVEIMEF
jgi:tRNA U34 5-carboxymethylaminomethyl modifying GTPase MnmE/TrmE